MAEIKERGKYATGETPQPGDWVTFKLQDLPGYHPVHYLVRRVQSGGEFLVVTDTRLGGATFMADASQLNLKTGAQAA